MWRAASAWGILRAMPYGIHFVSRDENPVGFLVWRIASLTQDASLASEEAGVESGALDTLRDDHTPFDFRELGSGEARAAASADMEAAEAARQVPGMSGLLSQALQLASGKDPHDPDTIAALEKLVAQAQTGAQTAEADADAGFGNLESRTDW